MKLNYTYSITFILIILAGMCCTHTIAAHSTNEFFSPDPIIGGENSFVCENDTMTYFVANTDIFAPGTTFSWSTEVDGTTYGTIIEDNGDNILVAWGDINPSSLTVTATALGCATSTTIEVTIRPPETFSLDVNTFMGTTIVCDGDTVLFGADALYEQFPVDESEISYQWFVNGVPAGTNSPDFEFTNAIDGDMVYCEATSTFNCLTNSMATSNILTITVIPEAIVDILIVADPNPVCPGDAIAFSTMTMNTGLQPTYEWQVNGVTVGNFPFYGQTGLVAGDTVTCSLLSENICALNNPAIDTIIIEEIEPFPATITIEPDMNPACAGELVVFTSTLVNEGDTPTFQWFVNGMPVLNQTSDIFGLYTFADGDVISCEMVSSSNCASNALAISNEVILQLGGSFTTNVTLDAPNPFCIGSGDVEFTANVDNPAPNPTFTWEINGAQSVTTPNNQIALPIDDGDVVTVTYTADFGDCYSAGDTTDMLVMEGQNIVPLSVILVADDDEICSGESITFTPMPENGGSSPEYQWFLNGVPFGGNMNTYTTNVISDGDIFSVELTSSLDCADIPMVISNGIQVRVSDVVAQIVSVDPVCNGAGTIVADASGGISNTYTYAWSDGQSGNTADSLAVGTYTVTVTDEAGCTDTISADISAVDAPEILDGIITTASCGYEDGTITIDFIGGAEPYKFVWTDSTGMLFATDSLQLTAGTGTYTVSVTDASDCYATATYFIDEAPPINVVAPEDVTIDLGDSIRIVAYAETLGPVDFMWSPEMGVSCLTCPITYVSPYQTTTYTLTMTQPGGCTSTDEITVTVNENSRVFIPNIFSPNNDGFNDVFVVNTGPGVARMKSFRVFDRWGALVHSVENAPANRDSSGWDGTYNRTPHSQGVYVYFVQLELLNGRVINFSGDVTLVR